MTNSSKETKMRFFIGKKVRITHKDSIFLPTEGICKDVCADPPGQEDHFEIWLEDGFYCGIIPDTFGENFVEGTIRRARGRRKVEVIE